MDQELTFEKAMKRLEEISQRIQNPQCSLDEGLQLYKEGIELSNYCNSKLQDFSQKLNELNEKAEEND